MRSGLLKITAFLATPLVCGFVGLSADSRALAQETADYWPLEIDSGQVTITIYQPQMESFADDALSARAAVSVTAPDHPQPVFGAVWIDGRLLTDRDTRLVTLTEVKVTAVNFPEADEAKLQRFKEIVETEIPRRELTWSLDQLLASLELVEMERAAAENLNNAPPKIIYTTEPATLILIDGDPQLREIEDTSLEFVINTPFLILLDQKSRNYFLKGGDWWYTARSVMGPWQLTESVPDEALALAQKEEEAAAQAMAEAEAEQQSESETAEAADSEVPTGPETEPASPPAIIVSTEPAELISVDGEPSYTPIEGTTLLYMDNTDSDILMDIASQKYFLLLAGRWYAADSLAEGDWTFIPPDQVPPEFANIPAESEMGLVRVSVAGTQEAKEAVLDNQIPQTAEVDRQQATVSVAYDGDPQFEPVEDTQMYYAVNTDKSVLLVNGRYYCCNQAIWFEAAEPQGPWIVCVEVPAEIQSLPPSCPVYNVKYVYVYDSTPEVVYVGYTPGYMGSYMWGGCVFWGTGYWYRPWTVHVYYPRPVTWGFRAHYNPWTGWGFSFGVRFGGPGGWFRVGVGWGYPMYRGWWGPAGFRSGYWHGYRRGYARGYHAGRRAGFAAGYRAATRNNIYHANRNGVRRTGGRPVAARPDDRMATGRGQADRTRQPQARDGTGRDRSAATPQQRDRGGGRENNVFTDRDGNVYRNTENGWERREGNEWKPDSESPSQRDRSQIDRTQQDRSQVDRSQQDRSQGNRSQYDRSQQDRSRSDRNRQELNRQNQARQRGYQRSQEYGRSQRPSSPSHGQQRSGGGRGRR